MDLIVWRHAEAFDPTQGQADALRELTPKGEKQAKRMAAWLDRQLPNGVRVLVSPALRSVQTAQALDRKHVLRRELSHDSGLEDVLQVTGWPDAKMPVLVVGHQPTLGRLIAHLLGLPEQECAVRKGAVWWLRSRWREGALQTVIVTVQNPDLL